MSENTGIRPQHIDALTWLRGIAAFIVILFHVKRATNVSYTGLDEASDYLIMELLDLGNFGVLLFFVISGTTLFINNNSLSHRTEIYTFFLKRFFRIWPAYFVSFIVFLLLIPVFEHFYLDQKQGLWIEIHANSSYSIVDIIAYLGLVFNITGPPGLFNVVYWSLPVEFQYYILFPLILLSLRWISYLGPIVIGGVIYLSFSLGLGRYIQNEWTLMMAYTFCGGVLIGYLYKNFREIVSFTPLIAITLVTPGIMILSLLEGGFLQIPEFLRGVPIIAEELNWQGFSAIFVVLVVMFTRFNAERDNHSGWVYRFLMRYGEVSYSIYLYHMLFIAISVLIIINLGITTALIKVLFTLIFTLLGSFLLANYSYQWIELSGINYGRRLVLKQKARAGGRG